MSKVRDKIILETLQLLRMDMIRAADLLNGRGNKDKSSELYGAASVLLTWIDGIKKESA